MAERSGHASPDRLPRLEALQVPQDWAEIIRRSDGPGVVVFDFPADEKSHAMFVHDVRWLLLHHWPTPNEKPIGAGLRQLWRYGWPLDKRYTDRGPVLRAVILG